MIELVAFSLVPRVGRVTLAKIIRNYGYGRTLSDYLQALVAEYPARERQVATLDQTDLIKRAKELIATASNDGQRLLSWFSDGYPQALKHTNDPPPFLLSVGNFIYDTDMYSLAFVSGGRPTSKGYEIVDEVLGSATHLKPLRVFTGLGDVLNIHVANEGLERNHVVISAFLPCGLDIPYPVKNADLYHRLRQKGVLYSEFFPGQTIESYRAIERDALVISASHAIVLVEGKWRGRVKRMIELARTQGKPVYYSPEMVDYSEAVDFIDATGQGIPLGKFKR